MEDAPWRQEIRYIGAVRNCHSLQSLLYRTGIMHSSLSIINENEKEGVDSDDAGNSQRLMRLFHTLGPSVHAGSPLRPPHTYPANFLGSPLNVHRSWPSLRVLTSNDLLLYHKRVNTLGARIPQELFDIILGHADNRGHTHTVVFSRKTRSFPWGLPSFDSPIYPTDWESCTLVCRHWANKCRQYIFGGAVLMITSPQVMDEFIQYSFHGCPLLLSLHKVIGGIHIQQTHHATRSFCHHAQLLKLANVPIRLLELCPREGLSTPIPYEAGWHPSSIPKTPHWSIPPTVATPPSLLSGCRAITVKNAHMASFSHVVQLVRHFSSVSMKSRKSENCDFYVDARASGSMRYDRLSWDNYIRVHDFPVYRKPVLCRRAYIPNYVHIEATDCTDDVRLCMYTAVARPTFAMHWMQEDERRWMFSLVTSFDRYLQIEEIRIRNCVLYSDLYDFGVHQWPRICWQSHAVYVNHTHWERPVLYPPEATVTVAFCLGQILRDTPAPTVRVVGLEVDFPWNNAFRGPFPPVGFDALLAKIRSCPTTLVINFRFPKLDLQEHLQKYRPFNWNPETETHTIIFTYSAAVEPAGLWMGIDPVTLRPTGQTWQHHRDIIPSLVSEQGHVL